MILIYIVTSTVSEAEHIGHLLLENHLCACVNIIPGMRSMYRWNGNIEKAEECVLLVKTEKGKYAEVERRVKEHHSYEVPAIFSIDVEQVEPAYGDWLKNQLK